MKTSTKLAVSQVLLLLIHLSVAQVSTIIGTTGGGTTNGGILGNVAPTDNKEVVLIPGGIQSIALTAGQGLIVKIPTDSTAGYMWAVQDSPKDLVDLVDISFDEKKKPILLGSPTIENLLFTTKGTGKGDIVLVSRRGCVSEDEKGSSTSTTTATATTAAATTTVASSTTTAVGGTTNAANLRTVLTVEILPASGASTAKPMKHRNNKQRNRRFQYNHSNHNNNNNNHNHNNNKNNNGKKHVRGEK